MDEVAVEIHVFFVSFVVVVLFRVPSVNIFRVTVPGFDILEDKKELSNIYIHGRMLICSRDACFCVNKNYLTGNACFGRNYFQVRQ